MMSLSPQVRNSFGSARPAVAQCRDTPADPHEFSASRLHALIDPRKSFCVERLQGSIYPHVG